MAGPSVTLSLVDPGQAANPVTSDQIPIYLDIAAAGSLTQIAVSNFTTWPHAAVMIAALRAAHRVASLLIAETLRKATDNTSDGQIVVLSFEVSDLPPVTITEE
jgi:hypothetical protein